MKHNHAPPPGTNAPADAVVALCGDLTIYRAAEVREELLAYLRRGVQRFDLAGVTEIDTAGLQLLAAVRASAAQSGGHIQFDAPAQCVRQTLELCGLNSWLTPAPQKETT
jgi:anti-anti-sigma factor